MTRIRASFSVATRSSTSSDCFWPTSTNEARLVDQIDTLIGKVVDLGFLRRIKDQVGLFEVRRILKAFVDGQWLADFDARLAEYAQALSGDDVAAKSSVTEA
jgi:Domain of unknown function (DUF4194)